jgi:hypothetical protein
MGVFGARLQENSHINAIVVSVRSIIRVGARAGQAGWILETDGRGLLAADKGLV